MEPFEVDDTRQGERNVHRRVPWYSRFGLLLAYPLHLISGIFKFIFGVLHIPIPQFRFTGLSFYRAPRPLGNIDTWVRELEEETGARCIGHDRSATATGAQTAGPSTLSSRTGGVQHGKVLPSFATVTYEEALRACQTEMRIGCIILVSEEHDDVPVFKRNTLTDPAFVNILKDNNFIVWGGDVRERDAWNASQKLQATTYPCVAFVALQQPRRTGSGSSTTPALTVLSRHQGPSTPETGPTSSATLVAHIQHALLPRVLPFLERISWAQRDRENDRRLREEQDRAYEETARKDGERIKAKMDQERQQKEDAKRAAEEGRLDAIRREADAKVAAEKEALRMRWRRWTRGCIVHPAPPPSDSSALRIAIRMSGDTRVVRTFAADATLTQLYAFVDSQLIPGHFELVDDPRQPPGGGASSEDVLVRAINAQGVGEYWGFKLVSAYPRKEIPWSASTLIVEVDELKRGGQIAVEMNDLGRRSSESRGRKSMNNGDRSFGAASEQGEQGDDDGYETESDSD